MEVSDQNTTEILNFGDSGLGLLEKSTNLKANAKDGIYYKPKVDNYFQIESKLY